MTRDFAAKRSAPALVGRERELARLLDQLRAPAADRVDVLLIAGEPGVGKTRLMLEGAAAAKELGWTVLTGHAYESEGMPPYLPFIEALGEHVHGTSPEALSEQLQAGAPEVALILPELRRRLPDIPGAQPADPQTDRYRLFEAVSDFLLAIARAETSGLVLCLDDLHWADDSTLLLLEHLVRRTPDAPVVILATYRDTDLEVGRPFARTLEQLTRQRLSQRLDLKRLGKEGVADLLAALGGPDPPPALVDAMYGETEGNPFFVQEVYEFLSESGRLFDPEGAWLHDLEVGETEVPQGVRLVIGRRLERLSEECRRVLAMGAVLGRTFSYEVLRAMQDVPEEALLDTLDEAQAARLLDAAPDHGLAYGHELVRQTLLHGLSPPRRQRLHLRAAQAIEALYAADLEPRSAELADHYLQSPGDVACLQSALDYTQRAALRAEAVFAYAEAVRLYRRALEVNRVLAPDDKAKRADLLSDVARALPGTGEFVHQIENEVEEAYDLALELGDEERACRACVQALSALTSFGANAVARSLPLWTERASRHGGRDHVLRVHENIARSVQTQSFEESHDLQMEAIDTARRFRVDALPVELHEEAGYERSQLLYAVTLHTYSGWSPATVAGDIALVREFIDLRDDRWPLMLRTVFFGHAFFRLMEQGERAKAETLLARYTDMNMIIRHPFIGAYLYRTRALLSTFAGDLDDVLAASAELVSRAQALSAPPTVLIQTAGANRALIYRGAAGQLFDIPGLPDDFPDKVLMLVHAGRLDEARPIMSARAEVWDTFDLSKTAVGILCSRLGTAILLQERDMAARIVEVLRPVSGLLSLLPNAFTCIARLLGDADLLLGDLRQARADYEQAIEVCEKVRWRPEIAMSRLGLAEALLRSYPAERTAALEHLDFAIGEFEAMGMKPALDKALRLQGRRKPLTEPVRPSYPDGLSGREVEVLRLIVAGHSNAEIADQLVISPNTVIRHVSNIFAKVGVANRTQAAVYAQDRGLT